MLNRLPIEVNPYYLIEQRRILDGRIPLRTLSRIQELTRSNEGDVAVYLEFIRTDTGLPTIKGTLDTTISLQCQRCLGLYNFEINSEFEVVLITTDAEAERLQDSYDTWLVENDKIFIKDFVEDELLLSLPAIAKHEDCELNEAAKFVAFDVNSIEIKQMEQKDNPFAVLKDIFKN